MLNGFTSSFFIQNSIVIFVTKEYNYCNEYYKWGGKCERNKMACD